MMTTDQLGPNVDRLRPSTRAAALDFRPVSPEDVGGPHATEVGFGRLDGTNFDRSREAAVSHGVHDPERARRCRLQARFNEAVFSGVVAAVADLARIAVHVGDRRCFDL